MTDVNDDAVPRAVPPTGHLPPEEAERLIDSWRSIPSADPPPSKGALRRKLLVAVVIAGVGVGASVMSCVGQSFSLRQARALEGIEDQLREIRASCPALVPPSTTHQSAR